MKVIYVLGSQRGGTTIVGRVLGTIAGCAFGGELRNFWASERKACGCGKPREECEVWSAVRAEPGPADSRSVPALQRRAVPRGHAWWHVRRLLGRVEPLGEETPEGAYARALEDLYRAFARASGAEVVIDSSKHPGDAALLSRAPGVSLFCIQIVRDARGAVFDGELRRSRRRRIRADAGGGKGRRRAHPGRALHAGAAWVGRHRTSAAVLERLGPERSLVVRYEDFCADPEATLARVCRLVGLPPRWPALADGAVRLPTAHTPAGSGRRRSEDVVVVEDERWKADMPPFDWVLATILTAPWLRRYGYRLSAPPARLRGVRARG